MNNQIDEVYLAALVRIWVKGPDDRTSGICGLVLNYCQNIAGDPVSKKGRLSAAFKSWPMRSGDPLYPVPHPEMGPGSAFVKIHDLWLGEYGFDRYQALNHLIKVEMGWV